jgi:pilus assembly protein CpaF
VNVAAQAAMPTRIAPSIAEGGRNDAAGRNEPSGGASAARGGVMDHLFARLVELVATNEENYSRIMAAQGEAQQRKVIAFIAEQAIDEIDLPDGFFLTRALRANLLEELYNEILGFGPIDPLIHDPTITEIMVNGPSRVFIERDGLIHISPVHFRSREHLTNVIERIVSRLGRRIDESSPLVDARLPDGSRVNAAINPVALNGPFLTIRKFPPEAMTLGVLLERKALNFAMAEFLREAIASRMNIIISGGTGAGKTTLLNALVSLTPPNERIVTVEDSAEIRFSDDHVNVCSFEARPTNIEGKGAITIRDLIRNALRMRPDRLVVGEVRGAEAMDMLQAMNTGHEGSFTTVHANSPQDLCSRLETMVCMASTELSIASIRETIASAIHLVIQVSRLLDGSRKISQVAELCGGGGDGRISVKPIWTLDLAGEAFEDDEEPRYLFHGVPERTRERFEAHGISLHPVYLAKNADDNLTDKIVMPSVLSNFQKNM